MLLGHPLLWGCDLFFRNEGWRLPFQVGGNWVWKNEFRWVGLLLTVKTIKKTSANALIIQLSLALAKPYSIMASSVVLGRRGRSDSLVLVQSFPMFISPLATTVTGSAQSHDPLHRMDVNICVYISTHVYVHTSVYSTYRNISAYMLYQRLESKCCVCILYMQRVMHVIKRDLQKQTTLLILINLMIYSSDSMI